MSYVHPVVLWGAPTHPVRCPFRVFDNTFAYQNKDHLEEIPAKEMLGLVVCSLTFDRIANYRHTDLLFDDPEYRCLLTEGKKCTRTMNLG